MKNYSFNILILLFSLSLSVTAADMQEYFRYASENNPGLNAEFLDYQAAMQQAARAAALPDPNFTVAPFISPVETRVGAQELKLSLSQSFPWFGILKARGDAAALQAEAAYMDYLNARDLLFSKIAAAYYDMAAIHLKQQIEEENADILNSYKNFSSGHFRSSTGSLVDVLRVNIMLKEANSRIKILEEQFSAARAEFNALLGMPVAEMPDLPDSLMVKDIVIPDNSPSPMLQRHPLILALDLRIKSAEMAAKAAKLSGRPNIGLGLDYVVVSPRNDTEVTDNGKDVIMPMLSLNLPLFRKKYRADTERAHLIEKNYSLLREQQLNELNATYTSVRSAIFEQDETYQLHTAQLHDSQQALQLLFTSYSSSGDGFEDVLNMQKEILHHRRQMIDAAAQLLSLTRRMNYIVGSSPEQAGKNQTTGPGGLKPKIEK